MATTNSLVQALLTDRYQLTMAYAYWKAGRHEKPAVFDLFFRQCPFNGEFAIFAGLNEVLEYVNDFSFSDEDIEYLKAQPAFRRCESGFFDWLYGLDASEVKIFAPAEGTVIFPRVPILRVEGPLAVCQLLETTLLNLINYPTLIATNAAHFRLAAGPNKRLLEFGLRRAQGPDGGLTASRSAYLGGFDATSNELAGKLFGIPVSGTHAHALVQSGSPEDLHWPRMLHAVYDRDGTCDFDLTKTALMFLSSFKRQGILSGDTNEGELAMFLDYAYAFPDSFLALIDTYNTLQSGLMNFLAVAVALDIAGYKPVGVRIDSGDLSHLSKVIRQTFKRVGTLEGRQPDFTRMIIVASNDINEETLLSLNDQEHEINVFGIGTHLVTCQAQPALGGVYKLVALDGRPCIKLSEDWIKTTIPGCKRAYRLFGSDGQAILDLMTGVAEPEPLPGQPVFCRHPFIESKRAQVVPSRVEAIHQCVWDGEFVGARVADDVRDHQKLNEARELAALQLKTMIRADHLRPLNPTPYKVSVSQALYDYLHQLMQSEAPLAVLS